MKTRLPFKILTLTMTLLLFIMGCQEEDLRDAMLETEQVETVAKKKGLRSIL